MASPQSFKTRAQPVRKLAIRPDFRSTNYDRSVTEGTAPYLGSALELYTLNFVHRIAWLLVLLTVSLLVVVMILV